VETKERTAVNWSAPALEPKQPETLSFGFAQRIARSAVLLVKGTRQSPQSVQRGCGISLILHSLQYQLLSPASFRSLARGSDFMYNASWYPSSRLSRAVPAKRSAIHSTVGYFLLQSALLLSGLLHHTGSSSQPFAKLRYSTFLFKPILVFYNYFLHQLFSDFTIPIFQEKRSLYA